MRAVLAASALALLGAACSPAQAGGMDKSVPGNLPANVKLGGEPYAITTNPGVPMKCTDCYPGTSTSTTFTCSHLGAPTSTGTVTAQPALTGATRMYLQYATAASTNSVGGVTSPASNAIRAHLKPMMGATFRWAGEANLIAWIGLAESTLSAAPWAPDTGPTASGVDLAAIGYQSSVSSKFRCCTGDGTNYSCADMVGAAATPTSAHEYFARIDPRTEAGVATTCYLKDLTDGTTATLRKTTNVLVTTAATNMYFNAAVTTTEAVAKNWQLADIYMCFN